VRRFSCIETNISNIFLLHQALRDAETHHMNPLNEIQETTLMMNLLPATAASPTAAAVATAS
jgi:hypothetical protein